MEMTDREGRIAVLMTCHNRVSMTVACLARLMPQLSEDDRVFLVDDGSTDGTGAKVRASFPAVHVVDGDGSLYWARGMALAWRTAIETGVDWRHYLWLNDDTMLSANALSQLLAADDGSGLLVGSIADASGKVVYGLGVNGRMNGNCVLVPKSVHKKIGMICGGYAHAWADDDYAIHAGRMGIPLMSAGVIGTAEWHPLRPDLGKMAFRERWRSLTDPKGWNLHDLWLYRRRNWGICAAVLSSLHMFVHVLCARRSGFPSINAASGNSA